MRTVICLLAVVVVAFGASIDGVKNEKLVNVEEVGKVCPRCVEEKKVEPIVEKCGPRCIEKKMKEAAAVVDVQACGPRCMEEKGLVGKCGPRCIEKLSLPKVKACGPPKCN
ncbi:unnamed protein product, partial [Mesorhabditis belari]|uniref:Uncharacterized protein n=1 Tax=Mesorhabditis belari TaxID=2138241 RepID=A0AAF3FV25_9BILA